MTEHTVNFTREPIIETVITPRDGCTLVVRNSKGKAEEDYLVEAVEVVSFGNALFFRSQERPKSFLVPVSDYEIFELKEARMALKTGSSERSIKIGGGREPSRPQGEQSSQETPLEGSRPAPAPQESRSNKRDGGGKRRRGRRGRDRQDYNEPRGEAHSQEAPREEFPKPPEEHQSFQDHVPPAEEGGEPGPEKLPTFISKLFPPPQVLIRDTLSRYKPAETDQPISFDETSQDEPSQLELEDDNEE